MEIVSISKIEADQLAERMTDYWVSWAQQVGPDAVAMLKEVRAAVGK